MNLCGRGGYANVYQVPIATPFNGKHFYAVKEHQITGNSENQNLMDSEKMVNSRSGENSEKYKFLVRETYIQMILKDDYFKSDDFEVKSVLARTTLLTNVVRMFTGLNKVCVYTCMEFMSGNLDGIRTDDERILLEEDDKNDNSNENSGKMLKYGRVFTTNEILKMCYDLTLGLHFLHSRNIIHRDISTNNILVDIKNNKIHRALISDFGQSRHMQDKISTHFSAKSIQLKLSGLTQPSYLGKIHVRPPEGLYYVFEYNKLWDVWQLGKVFLTLISSSKYDHPYATARRLSKEVWTSLKVGEFTKTPDDRSNQLRTISDLLKVNIGPPLLNEWESLRDMTSRETLSRFNVDVESYREWYGDHWEQWKGFVEENRFWSGEMQDEENGENRKNYENRENNSDFEKIRVNHLKKLPLIKNTNHDTSENKKRRNFNGTCGCVSCSGDFEVCKSFMLKLIVKMLNYAPSMRPETKEILKYFEENHDLDCCVPEKQIKRVCEKLTSYDCSATGIDKQDLVGLLNQWNSGLIVTVVRRAQDSINSSQFQNQRQSHKTREFQIDLLISMSTRIILEITSVDRQGKQYCDVNDFERLKSEFESRYRWFRQNAGVIFGLDGKFCLGALSETVNILKSTDNPNSVQEFSLMMYEISRSYSDSLSVCLKVDGGSETGHNIFIVSMCSQKIEFDALFGDDLM